MSLVPEKTKDFRETIFYDNIATHPEITDGTLKSLEMLKEADFERFATLKEQTQIEELNVNKIPSTSS